MNKTKKGFTLFELLVSISIIGILTALGVVSFSAAQKKARDSRRIQDMDAVQKAAEQYYSQSNYVYPPAPTTPSGLTEWGKVMQMFPIDPKNSGVYKYTTYYVLGAGSTTYCACAVLENPTGNSSTTDCAGFVSTGGVNYCVKNQQ